MAQGELLAVFDADFVPAPRLPAPVGPATSPTRGSAWCRRAGRTSTAHTRSSPASRRSSSTATSLIEHTARHRSGCFFNFNGTAGVWRRSAIEAAGGWEHDTLTEDLDISYRAQLAGWRFLYLPDLAVPSELPVDINGFKSQQYRWAKGSVQTGRKLLGRILRARLPWRVKLEAFVHLTNNSSYLLTVLVAVFIFPAMVLRASSGYPTLLVVDAPLFLGATISVLLFYVTSQLAGGRSWGESLRYVPAVMAIGIGLSINNSRAVLSGLVQRGGTFHRTPKYRIERSGQDWIGKRYRAGADVSCLLEGAFAFYFAAAFLYALAHSMWLSLPFLYLFVQGYSYMFLLSVFPFLSGRGGRAVATEAALPA